MSSLKMGRIPQYFIVLLLYGTLPPAFALMPTYSRAAALIFATSPALCPASALQDSHMFPLLHLVLQGR